MTTVELAQHLLPVSKVPDLNRATPAQAQELALVMTQAVQEYFRIAPVCHRRSTLSERRPAAETLSVTVTNGSATVSGTPFLARQRGCSIRFPDGQWNEIVAPNQLLHDVPQASGTYSCTVYNDALAFDDFQVDRIMTDPEIVQEGNGATYLLSPWLPVGSRSVSRPSVLDLLMVGDAIPQRQHDTASWPTHYWTEHVGGSIAVSGDALFQFRFWPAPSEAYTVIFDAEILPDTYRIANVTTPSTLPVPDGHAQLLLVPLARGRLARSYLFDPDTVGKSDLLDAADEARAGIAALPAVFGPSHLTVATESGW